MINKKTYNPLVSIITPNFNGEVFLEKTIQSVINQSYQNIEYIVIDGGSTDGSHAIIEKYKKFINYLKIENDNGIMNEAKEILTKSQIEKEKILNFIQQKI